MINEEGSVSRLQFYSSESGLEDDGDWQRAFKCDFSVQSVGLKLTSSG